MFKDINNVDKIYIFGDEIIADSDFFEDIKGKIVYIIGDKDYILKIKQIENKEKLICPSTTIYQYSKMSTK